jgi:hypothetical protein
MRGEREGAPEQILVLPLRNSVLFPMSVVPINVGRPRSVRLVEELTGQEVSGYRAPSFSIGAETDWAFDVLVEEGYAYDSSVYPGRRGHPLVPRRAFEVRRAGGVLTEYPIATLRAAGRTLPAGGGAYLRLLPYALVRGGLRQAEREGAPAMFYIHPWELDPGQPRLCRDVKTRIRHYGGLRKTEGLLRGMLGDNRVAIKHTVESLDRAANTANALLKDNASTVRTSLFDLRPAARSFKELARDLRQNPSRLFFADAPRERKLP